MLCFVPAYSHHIMAAYRCIMAVLLLIGNHLIFIVNSQLGDIAYKYFLLQIYFVHISFTISYSRLKYGPKFSKIF